MAVANRTLGGEALAGHLRRLIEADPSSRFVVVVPLLVLLPIYLRLERGQPVVLRARALHDRDQLVFLARSGEGLRLVRDGRAEDAMGSLAEAEASYERANGYESLTLRLAPI